MQITDHGNTVAEINPPMKRSKDKIKKEIEKIRADVKFESGLVRLTSLCGWPPASVGLVNTVLLSKKSRAYTQAIHILDFRWHSDLVFHGIWILIIIY